MTMTLKDQLVEDIETSRMEEMRRRRRALSNDEWWAAVRELEIRPALFEAARALQETRIGGEVEDRNSGSGIALVAGHAELEQPPMHNLTFTHADAGIKVSSSESDIKNERWDRKHATPEALVSKIRAFVRLVAAHYPEPQSVYENRGPIIIDTSF